MHLRTFRQEHKKEQQERSLFGDGIGPTLYAGVAESNTFACHVQRRTQGGVGHLPWRPVAHTMECIGPHYSTHSSVLVHSYGVMKQLSGNAP
eukprot:759946-Pelagomonas_calceolata.AAC.3